MGGEYVEYSTITQPNYKWDYSYLPFEGDFHFRFSGTVKKAERNFYYEYGMKNYGKRSVNPV